MGVAAARSASDTLLVTAQPDGDSAVPRTLSCTFPHRPWPTTPGTTVSVLPMGSLFEGAQYILFEVMVLILRERLGHLDRSHAGQPHQSRITMNRLNVQRQAKRTTPWRRHSQNSIRDMDAGRLSGSSRRLCLLCSSSAYIRRCSALITSFRRYNITRRPHADGFPFVGLDNYVNVLSDQTFWDSRSV